MMPLFSKTLWKIPNIHMTYIGVLQWNSKVIQDFRAAGTRNRCNDIS